MPSPNDVLLPEHCKCLDAVLESCPITRELIEKCKALGLPVEEAEAANSAQEKMAREAKALFFPQRP